MRSFIVIVFLALAGCNGDDDSSLVTKAQLPPNESTQIAALRAEIAQLQLIGHPIGAPIKKSDSIETFRMLGEPTLAPNAVTVTGQFGTCPNMGVQEGFNTSVGDALSAGSKAFKTCTGYHTEYLTTNGAMKPAQRIFWDGPNCTGNLLEWEAGGSGYDTETLKDGVVFTSPQDGVTEFMVLAHQTPQSILIQSVWVTSNPGCQSDVETQLMYSVTPNQPQVTGTASNPVGIFTTGSP